jgi:anti-sigma factor RsiW
MAEQHPSEVTLLSYVEDDLTPDTRQDVAEHLVACRECAGHVRRLEAGRAALRSAPPLELSDASRARIMAELPDRHPRRTLSDYVRRGFLIAAPVAVAAALAAVVFTTDPQFGGGDDDESAGEAAADTGAAEAGGQEMEQSTGADATAPLSAGTLVRNVAGPATAVVNALAAEGIEAEVDENGAVVAQGTPAEVRAALEGRPSGIVSVYVR